MEGGGESGMEKEGGRDGEWKDQWYIAEAGRTTCIYITYTECRHMYLSQLQTLYCIHGEHIMSLHTTAQCTRSRTLHTCVFYCTVHHCIQLHRVHSRFTQRVKCEATH